MRSPERLPLERVAQALAVLCLVIMAVLAAHFLRERVERAHGVVEARDQRRALLRVARHVSEQPFAVVDALDRGATRLASLR